MSVHALCNPNILAGFAEQRELMMTSPLRRRPLTAEEAAAGNGEAHISGSDRERTSQAPTLKLRYVSRNGAPLMTACAERPQPPSFTEAAQKSAKASAIACGKPATRLEGLRAIHAVTYRNCFETEQAAWEHFSSSRQRFYEWKPRIFALAGPHAAGQNEPASAPKLLHVQPTWINKTSPSIIQLDVSELLRSSDGCQANRLLKATIRAQCPQCAQPLTHLQIEERFCDVCYEDLPTGHWGCDPCGFDICPACLRRARAEGWDVLEHELRVIWNSSYGQRKLTLGAAYANPESVVNLSIPGAYPVPCPDCGLALTVYSYKLDECLTDFQKCSCDEEELEGDSDEESNESEECGEETGSVVTDEPDEPDIVLETTVRYDIPKSESARLCADRNRKREEECIRGFMNRSPFNKLRKI